MLSVTSKYRWFQICAALHTWHFNNKKIWIEQACAELSENMYGIYHSISFNIVLKDQ